jgi:hypothetical protein
MNNKRPFLETLKEMKGKSFVYGETLHQLIDYSIDDVREKVTIKTDKKLFDRNYDSVAEFLTYFKLVVEAETIDESNQVERSIVTTNNQIVQSSAVYEEHAALAKDLIGILKENINKVRTDKNYIPQAQAINNNVNSIINVTKLQLDVYKQFKGKKAS